MTKSAVGRLAERIDKLEPRPRDQDDFSSRRLASEMRMVLAVLTETGGPDSLTDQYGKNYSSSILELVRKAESVNYVNAVDFVRQLNEDEQVALAHLIHKAEKAEITRDTLRSTFVEAFRAK